MALLQDTDRLNDWMQQAQVTAGAWVRPERCGAPLVACSELLERLPSRYDDRELGIVAVVLSRFSQRLVRDAFTVPAYEPRDPLFHIGMEYRDAGFDLDALARRLNRSRWHSCRIIRHETGRTFSELLHTIRAFAAIDLLAGTVLSVKEIADAIGYRSTGELDRQFQRRLHATPIGFRRAFDRTWLNLSGFYAAW